ncbi:uncharacterized protein HD556DRAFT_1455032 [Suillus plorans]|uniref:DUF6533 domain-containing protein n=1 Tax=Suillus plorans TaxID=116603 RepID=A0A9P7DPC9_9AGAM|nr:uncharacterized protein HD556DRAFT_1455032 [Suillus plorans]KAG1799754.1 hypothetical protein HD556DRAFT_1455032 [Suillus plorans]
MSSLLMLVRATQALDGAIPCTNTRMRGAQARTHPSSNTMTLILNDPSLWPSISLNRILSYFAVAIFTGVIYDWVLTFGLEVELVWSQHWSLMTVLFLSVRYLGISYVLIMLLNVPTISMTDAFDVIPATALIAVDWVCTVANAMLGLIMLVRLYAMYQRSRKVLLLLVVIYVPAIIFDVVAAATIMRNVSGEEVILSGTYQCAIDTKGDYSLLDSITWIFGTVWEVLALFLAVWIAVKHFRELQQHSAGGTSTINDCFTVLMKTHLVYFASVVGLSCLGLSNQFSTILTDDTLRSQIYAGLLMVFRAIQMCVLGPRLILGVRKYHAKLVADSDLASDMASIAFQERVHVSTSSSVEGDARCD